MKQHHCLTIFAVLLCFSVLGQDKKETSSYFDLIKAILTSEKLGNNLVYRLDTLQSKFIPSRSFVNDYFNREMDIHFKHRRISMSINFAEYKIDLLCRNDTVFLYSITAADYHSIHYEKYEKEIIDQFLTERNKLYSSSKTAQQLINEISLSEEYAFYCGDGMPKTKKGKFIEQLVVDEDSEQLVEMLKSLNCETQAYGVTGLEMLQKRDYEIPNKTQKLIEHIKKRNTELIICSGCFSGLVERIYPGIGNMNYKP